jgi:hypothetical protein
MASYPTELSVMAQEKALCPVGHCCLRQAERHGTGGLAINTRTRWLLCRRSHLAARGEYLLGSRQLRGCSRICLHFMQAADT